jgi:hypothetical protein
MRLTIAIAVIMVEISDDVHMLLPVLVAIMVAKWVADAATHSIYHTLLEVKCVPFLVHEPASKFSLDLLPISCAMRSPVVCLELHMKVRTTQGRGRGAGRRAGTLGCRMLPSAAMEIAVRLSCPLCLTSAGQPCVRTEDQGVC